jgi:transcriptional regulator with XRE-family HTH domain
VAALGQRLREVRERYEWTRADVAQLCGGRWSASALGTYERGERVMTAVALFALADLYRVPAIELFDGKPAMLAAPPVGVIVIDMRRLLESPRWPRLKVFIDAVQRERQGPRRRLVALRSRDLPALAALHDDTVDRFLALLAADGLISGVEPS